MSTVSPSNVNNSTAPVSTNQPAESTMEKAQKISELGGRILLSVLFLLSGLGKIGAYGWDRGLYVFAWGACRAPSVRHRHGSPRRTRHHARLEDAHHRLSARRLHAADGLHLPQQLRRS